MDFPSTVDAYLTQFFEQKQFAKLDLTALRTIDELARSKTFRYLGRRKLIRKFFARLFEVGLLAEATVHFVFCRKRVAFMKESGHVYFDIGKVICASGDYVARLMLHEAAHMMLVNTEGYFRLKLLNRAFATQYGIGANVASPIEYYATLWSVDMMRDTVNQCGTEGLLNQIQFETNKLSLAYGSIEITNNKETQQ